MDIQLFITYISTLFFKLIYFWLCWVFGLSLVVVSGLLIVLASLVVEQGL